MDSRWNKAGLAAVILLAPGGFLVGAALAGRYVRQRFPRNDGPASGHQPL